LAGWFRTEGASASGSTLFFEELLLTLLDVKTSLQATNTVDEEDPIEMVNFVLDTNGA
jgi:hypothetical protein